jgi:thioredoxin 1
MVGRRGALAALVGLAAFGASLADAAQAPKPFEQKAFEASLAAGGPVIVHVAAPWCVICRAQKPILAALRAEPRFGGFELYEIDFDNDKPSVRAVGARLQSTIIVYKGGKEVGHTVGDREEGWIEDLLEKAL